MSIQLADLPSSLAFDLFRARTELIQFTTWTKPDYQVARHHRIMGRWLDRLAAGVVKRLMIFAPPRHGKLIADDTPILTPTGWRRHGELRPGDFVYGSDGRSTEILAVSEAGEASLLVVTSDGEEIACHPNHEWTVYDSSLKRWMTVEAKHFLGVHLRVGVDKPRCRYQLPARPCLAGSHPRMLPVDPYVLGVWLGDGTSSKAAITHAESDKEHIAAMRTLGYPVSKVWQHQTTGVLTTAFCGPRPNVAGRLHKELKGAGLLNNKHVPTCYLSASVAQRLQLLAGLIDTDGHVGKDGRVRISTAMPTLCDGIVDLVRTLGFRCETRGYEPTTSSSGIVGRNPVFQVCFSPNMAVPTRLPRKRIDGSGLQRVIGIAECRVVESRVGRCIQVDARDGLYLVGKRMVPTHNSELVSRRLPAYFLGRNPSKEVILTSHGADLASRMNRDVQRVIDDPKFRQVFPGVRLPVPGERSRGRWGGSKPKRTDSYFELVGKKGCLRSAGVGGSITGRGFDLGIIDDPLKDFADAYSPVIREKLDEWYASTFWTRQAKDASILVTMTRWHHDDIAGRLIDRMNDDADADQWVVIRLPAVADDNLWMEDDRQIGEVLWPKRFDERFMQQAKGALGSVLFTGLYQGTPLQEGGNYFKSHWFDQNCRDAGEFWDLDVRGMVGKLQCPVFMTVDPAANEKRTADYTVIGVFAATPWNDLIVLDIIRERLPLEGIAKRMLEVSQKWKCSWAAFEATGFQLSICNQARRIPGMCPIREQSHEGKGKLVRAHPAVIKAESGQIFLMDKAKWKKKFVEELTMFTGVDDPHDDQVDVLSYAVWQLPRMAADRKKDEPINSEHTNLREFGQADAERLGLWGRGK